MQVYCKDQQTNLGVSFKKVSVRKKNLFKDELPTEYMLCFYPCFKFLFPLLLGVEMYESEFQERIKIHFSAKDKIEPQCI